MLPPPSVEKAADETPSAAGALFRVAAGAAMISTAPVFVKWAAADVGASAVGAWRCGVGALLLIPLAWAMGTRRSPAPRTLGLSLVAGIFFAVDLFLWHRAIVLAGAGMATILANTQVFWTTALGRVLFGARVRPAFVLAAALAFAGVVLLVGVGSGVEWTPSYGSGVALGLATGLAYATYVLALQRALHADAQVRSAAPALARAMGVLAASSAVAGLVLAAASLLEGERAVPAASETWLSLVGLALVPQVLGWIAITTGLERVAAARGGLVLLIQPILATAWGALFFGEALSATQLAGASMTLAAIYWGSTIRSAA